MKNRSPEAKFGIYADGRSSHPLSSAQMRTGHGNVEVWDKSKLFTFPWGMFIMIILAHTGSITLGSRNIYVVAI